MENLQSEIPDYTQPSDPVKWYHNGWFSRSFVIIAGLFFLLPFININCSGKKLATVKGIDLVTGSEIRPEMQKVEDSDSDTAQAGDGAQSNFDLSGDFMPMGVDRNIPPNVAGITAFASLILMLVFSFFNKRVPILISGGFSLLAALCLFFIQVQINKEVETKLGPFNFVPITFEFTPYYWLCLMFLAIAAVLAFVRGGSVGRG